MGRKKKEHEHPDERWLVSYADMITLLMVLFVVLFAISSVNKGKFDMLAKSLKRSFSGPLSDGGSSILLVGGQNATLTQPRATASSSRVLATSIAARAAGARQAVLAAQAKDRAVQKSLEQVKQHLDQAAKRLGIAKKVSTTLTQDGLLIRITDSVLFDLGSDKVRPYAATVVLPRIAKAIDPVGPNLPIRIVGHTDGIPFLGSQYGNFKLSTDRGVNVAIVLFENGLSQQTHPDVQAGGRGSADPLPGHPNSPSFQTPINRRVEILIQRPNYAARAAFSASGPVGANPAGIPQIGPPPVAIVPSPSGG